MNISVLGSIPEEIRDHVRMLLNTEPTVRPDADQFSKVSTTEFHQCQFWHFNLCSLSSDVGSILSRCGCHDSAISRHIDAKRQFGEVAVLQKSTKSGGQATKGVAFGYPSISESHAHGLPIKIIENWFVSVLSACLPAKNAACTDVRKCQCQHGSIHPA